MQFYTVVPIGVDLSPRLEDTAEGVHGGPEQGPGVEPGIGDLGDEVPRS